jgi:hypothetical protein
MVGPSETLGSLRIPHGIKNCRDVWVEVGNRRCQSSGGQERNFLNWFMIMLAVDQLTNGIFHDQVDIVNKKILLININ